MSPLAWLATGAIRLYQLVVSPLMPSTCRFQPTCSAYALEAVKTYGAVRGGWLAIKRIGRCHPWGGQGFDPVPPRSCCSQHKPCDGADMNRNETDKQ